MIPLSCPSCQSKNTVYKGDNTFECRDCNNKWTKQNDFKLPKNPELLIKILEEDNKIKKLPNVSISQNSLERRRR